MYRRGLVIFRELGDAWAASLAVSRLGVVASLASDEEHSAELLAVGEAARLAIGRGPRSQASQISAEQKALGWLRAVLGEAGLATASACGSSMSLDEVIEHALRKSLSRSA